MTDNEKDIRLKLKDDFIHYCSKSINIKYKSGKIGKLNLNRGQLYLYERMRDQLRRTGRIRLVILKSRQIGFTTEIQAWFLQQLTHSFGKNAFILTNSADATDSIFKMTKLMYEELPNLIKPSEKGNNKKELLFDKLRSGYAVGTARTDNIGRGSTIQLFHGSEVAYWKNAYEHASGLLQTIPMQDDTAIFLESTANGKGNYFYDMWQLATSGESIFEAVFVPWFWHEEYSVEVKDGEEFVLSEKEAELKRLYSLTRGQVKWRRIKIKEYPKYKDAESEFRQEYPCTAEEAFVVSGGNSLISSESVQAARKSEVEAYGQIILGVDPARNKNDKGDYTAVICRQGRKAWGLELFREDCLMTIVEYIRQIIAENNVEMVCVDVIGVGAGVVDRLREIYGRGMIKAVCSAERATNRQLYANKRIEMWVKMEEWFSGDVPVQIPDSDYLHSELCAPFLKHNTNNKMILESKDDMKTRGVKSPDSADALAFTFAFPYQKSNVKITPSIQQVRLKTHVRPSF